MRELPVMHSFYAPYVNNRNHNYWQNSHFGPQTSLKNSDFFKLDHPGFPPLDLVIVSLHSKVASLAFNPQNGGPRLFIYVPQ